MKILSNKAVKYIAGFIIIAGVGSGVYYIYKNMSQTASSKNSMAELTAKVARGDLAVTISGTGTIQPIARYDIVPLVKGSILSAPFEEGMDVKVGELLYKIDESDLSFNIEKSKIALDKLTVNNQSNLDSISNLVVTAPFAGKITNLTLVEGDQVSNNGKVADLVDDKKLEVLMPYDKILAQKASVGQSVQVAFDTKPSPVSGTIRYINNNPKASDNGVALSEVEIDFDQPVAVTDGTIVTVKLTGPQGPASIYGKVSYSKKQGITAQTSGKVQQVLVKNDQYVEAGQKILILSNDTLMNTNQKYLLDMKDSQLSMESQAKQLKDYTILSPITGKVIKKNYKVGDSINNLTANTVLMTVADVSKMIFNINVDELDISKVAVGQKVEVTADALPGSNLTGEVTNISMEGTTSNGVTTYTVQVTISEPGKLKPGMNVNAKIQVESKKNVLYVPVSAVTKKGNKAYVTVKADSGAAAAAPKASGTQPPASGQPSANPGDGQTDRQQRRTPPNGQQTGQPSSAQPSAAPQNNGGSGQKAASSSDKRQVEVVLGINTDSYIEIVSGLNEGDTVYLPTLAGSTAKTNVPSVQGGGMLPGGGGNVRIQMGR